MSGKNELSIIIAFNKNDCECGNRSNKFVLKLVSGGYFAFYSSHPIAHEQELLL